MATSHSLLVRWLGSLLAACIFLLWLVCMAGLYVKYGVVNHFITEGLQDPVTVRFALKSFLAEILPLYIAVGFLLFAFLMGIAKLLRVWTKTHDIWSFRHAFWGTVGLLGLVHALLWWQVPTTHGESVDAKQDP